MNTAEAIVRTLESPNVCDSNFENANVVDVLSNLAGATAKIAKAITPLEALPGRDASDGRVYSLTESVMGITAGLFAIAESIKELADSVSNIRGGS